MIQPILVNRLEQVRKILRSHRVKSAFAFGSVCRETFDQESDIDLLVDFEDGIDPIAYGQLYWDLAEQLEKAVDRSVDLVTLSSIRNAYFLQEVEATRETIL